MSRTLAAALALAAAIAFPGTAWAGHARTPECPQELCAGVSDDGSRVVFPFAEELTAGSGSPQLYEWNDRRLREKLRPRVTIPEGARPAPIGLEGTAGDAWHVFVGTTYTLAADDVDGGAWDLYDVGSRSVPRLISTGPLDTSGAALTSFAGASADGNRVFFNSITQPLLPGDSGSCWFVYERAGGATNPVVFGPRPQDPLPPHLCHGDSFDGVSADGSHLFLSTDRRLIDADEGEDDIYQRVGGALSLVTTYPERVGKSNCVDIPRYADASADGATVLFSTNIAVSPEDTDEAFDVYERRPDGSFVLISRGTDGGPGCGFSGDRAIALSADGTIAIFETRAQLSAADHDSSNDLYRAQDGAAPLLLSTGPTDPGGDEHSVVFPDWVTAVSADARTVAFETKAPLVAADRDHSMDVYVNVDGITALASTGPVGGGLGAAAELRGLSADGNTVVFATKGKLVPYDLDRDLDVYVRSVSPAATKLISAEAIPPQMRVARRGRLLASGRALVKVACPKAETSGPCHGTVTLTRGKRRLGRAPFRVETGAGGPVSVRLPGSLTLPHSMRVLVRGADQLGNTRVISRRVRF